MALLIWNYYCCFCKNHLLESYSIFKSQNYTVKESKCCKMYQSQTFYITLKQWKRCTYVLVEIHSIQDAHMHYVTAKMLKTLIKNMVINPVLGFKTFYQWTNILYSNYYLIITNKNEFNYLFTFIVLEYHYNFKKQININW